MRKEYIYPAVFLFSLGIGTEKTDLRLQGERRSTEINEATQFFELEKVTPRLFTPEEDNDTINSVRFYFKKPYYGEVTVKIYTVEGRIVRDQLSRVSGSENVMAWDGDDLNGDAVSGGVYIYVVEADGRVLTGTIGVVK